MVVLSLFDGMSCGQIAMSELGININKYYASELDKFAIKQTQYNFPKTIQLGDVTKWQEWDIDWSEIDILIGGSPCQGFSFAGKQLNFNDTRSKLFFVYVDILNHIKNKNTSVKFLLENVNMKKEYLRVISEYMCVFPVRINSNLVSAQNRDRWYWSNIRTKDVGLFAELWTDIPQPEDKGILLKDILQTENEIEGKYYLSEKAIKSIILNPNNLQKSNINPEKSNPLLHPGHSGGVYKGMTCVSMVGRRIDSNGKRKDNDKTIPAKQRLEPVQSGNKTNCLTSVSKDNLLTDGYKIRRLTPTECARLQTIPRWYEWIVSDTQIYRILGNGWTVEVIKHIFSFLESF